MFRDAASRQWTMLPWDVEAAFSIDRGLGGKPAPDYCTLACEQVRTNRPTNKPTNQPTPDHRPLPK